MDTFFDYLPALLIFWVVLRALRGAKRRRPPQRATLGPGAVAPAAPASGFTGFEDLVRRLEVAAAEAARQNKPAVVQPAPPALKPSPRSQEARLDEEEAFRALDAASTGEFHFVGAPDEPRQTSEFHETHPLAHAATASAHMPSLAMPSRDMPSRHIGEIGSPSARRLHPLAARLRTVATAREALLLKDVLGPPRSRGRR